MYKIIENDHNELVAVGRYGEESIHVVHCAETIAELQEEISDLFIVAEECTNFPRVHLVADFSKDEALMQVNEYLRENEGVTETHLIGIFEATI